MTEQELIEKIDQSSGKSVKITPRELLRCFGQERRSKFNNLHIKQFLQDNELVSSPDFLSVYMDVNVELKKKPKAKMTTSEKEEAVDYDPVSRIQLLESANRFPVTIKKECSIHEATTLMLMHDYSQLPVMNGTRQVDGLITWETIGNNLIHGGDKSMVKDFMKKNVTVIPNSTTLFDAVKFIIENEVVLIKNDTNEICGLVTATDISQQFVTISEPFLILEQIENHIRKLLDGKFSVDKLKEVANEEERSSRIESISDLTFGEYIRLMESAENWEEMKLRIDRSTFVKRLEEIRRIRNDVMHFHPDGIAEKDFDILRKTSSFFENLAGYMK
ncbi:CBS domain-containing protein [Algoriphagus sp.]|uniref:CBS domain-containing protein n=1 Tax=Algoriphagus sp. TaxID=1872435 RepID=UPI003F708829